MGCDSSYQQLTDREEESILVCKLLVKLLKELERPIPQMVVFGSKCDRGNEETLDEDTDHLCGLMKKLTPKQKKVYLDWNNKKWRPLAAWWEHHQEADKERKAKERRMKRESALRKSGLAKLTRAEKWALDL